jgi:hypothetical protein
MSDMQKKEVKKTKPNLNYLRDKDREKVRGRFHFNEVPGGTLNFVFRGYPGDPIESYSLEDGSLYTLPLGVAKHLNNDCWYPVHKYMTDDQGKPSIRLGQKVRRCSFESLEFVDINELQPEKDLVTVETL